jgi:prefoldin subunit 5
MNRRVVEIEEAVFVLEGKVSKLENDISEIKKILELMTINPFQNLAQDLGTGFEEIKKAQSELQNLSKLLNYDNGSK